MIVFITKKLDMYCKYIPFQYIIFMIKLHRGVNINEKRNSEEFSKTND